MDEWVFAQHADWITPERALKKSTPRCLSKHSPWRVMAKRRYSIDQLAEHGLRLAQVGNLEDAASTFKNAIALDGRNLDLPYYLAIVEEKSGNVHRAAALLTEVLRRKPSYPKAAARLSRLLARYRIDDFGVLDQAGLRAALVSQGIALQPIVDASYAWIAAQDVAWVNGIRGITAGEIRERDLGRNLIGGNCTNRSLGLELLHQCLRRGTVKNSGVERLLTGVRAAVLIDCRDSCFDDRGTFELLLALMVQGSNNDYAWAETPEEVTALDALQINRAELLAGDPDSTHAFLCAALYRPLSKIVSPALDLADVRQLKPRSLRETIGPQIAEQTRYQAATMLIPVLNPISDATSLKVAGQYEAAPYPRWQSLQHSPSGAIQRYLGRFVAPERLVFMNGDFDVLIAGCGTGQQALMLATAYGSKARLTAIDLSRASLAYASVMTARQNVSNVTLIQADVLDAPLLDRDFDIIQCVGVLHHMADWRAGWRALLSRLKPAGLMNIGLYSALARQGLRELRGESNYPGVGCSDAAARVYRRSLMLREDAAPGGYLKFSRDFYTLNTFRDLALHESEANVTIEEIAEFLDETGLVFRGFELEDQVTHEFAEVYPKSARPGLLADWASFERLNPHTFDAMYCFWVERAG